MTKSRKRKLEKTKVNELDPLSLNATEISDIELLSAKIKIEPLSESHLLLDDLQGTKKMEDNLIPVKTEKNLSLNLLENFHNFESIKQISESEQKATRPLSFAQKKMFPCKDCGKHFTRKDNLKTHYTLAHTNSFKYPCGKCNAKFDLFKKLQIHMEHRHNEGTSETQAEKLTPKEKKTIKSNLPKGKSMEIEEKSENEDEDEDEEEEDDDDDDEFLLKKKKPILKNFTCKECDRKFSRKGTLKSHFIQFHTNSQKYDCDECGEEFKMWSQLAGHMRFIHKKKYFPKSKKVSIELSMRGNSNFFKYSCEECGEKFRIWGQLTGHMRHLHGRKALNKVLHKEKFTKKSK